MKDPRRTYADYEELGRYLNELEKALGAFQTKVMDMWEYQDEKGRPTPSAYDKQVLDMVLKRQDLHSRLALEFRTEISDPDVPAGKPRIPSPFDEKAF